MPSREAPPVAPPDARDVDSLNRGLEILRCFRPPEGALGLAEISTRLGIPRSTVQRLTETLVAHGFLRRLAGDRFQPDSACLVVGHAMLASCSIARASRPILDELAARHDVHAVLGVRERLGMLCLVHATARKAAPIGFLGVGMLLPMTATALGRSWLWAQSGSLQGEIIQRTKVERGEHGARTIPGLYRSFQELEERGFCLASGEWLRDVFGVGTAVTLADGRSFGLACKVALPDSRKEQLGARLGAVLLDAAGRIRDAAVRLGD